MLAKIHLSCPPSSGLVRPLYHMSHDGLIPPDGGQCRHGGRHSLHHQDLWGLSLEKRARVSCHIFLSLRKRYHSPLPDNLGLKMLAKKGEGGFDGQTCAKISWGICKYQFPILPWDETDMKFVQKNSATVTAKNAYFARFATSRQKCVKMVWNGIKPMRSTCFFYQIYIAIE